jgi:hypothetical protein
MAQGIVDVLESVQIQEQHCHSLDMAFGVDDRLLDAVVQKHSVG